MSVGKSVSHPPVRSVRFVQVEPTACVSKQIGIATEKMVITIANLFDKEKGI